ncbi:hypothetical protein [Streptomyces sp. NPDC058486]|uniref:hypothetical protein n=1 Tax=unclassified Streptomyces TaxID=2593676 RepID=UPI0036692579
MTRNARLPVFTTRLRWSASNLAEIVPSLIFISWNAAGIALAGSLVVDEIDTAHGLSVASAPDLELYAEEQPQDAAKATASTHTYPYESHTTSPAHRTASLPLNGDGLREEVWS